MANNLLNQPININLESFSNAVKRLMKERKMTQSHLAKNGLLSKTTISRICRNSNDKGGNYTPTEPIIMAISLALNLTKEECEKQLLYAAFPERAFWGSFLDNRLSIHQANDILYDYGLPLLGNVEEE